MDNCARCKSRWCRYWRTCQRCGYGKSPKDETSVAKLMDRSKALKDGATPKVVEGKPNAANKAVNFLRAIS